MISLLSTAQAADAAGSIYAEARNALALQPGRTEAQFRQMLVDGRYRVWRLTGEDISGVLITRMVKGSEGPEFWLCFFEGRGRTAAAQRTVGLFETVARRAGCRWLCFAGRDWRRVFPDYDAARKDGEWHFRKRLVDG